MLIPGALLPLAAALSGGAAGALLSLVFLGDNCNDSGYPDLRLDAPRTGREYVALCVGAALGGKLAVVTLGSVTALMLSAL